MTLGKMNSEVVKEGNNIIHIFRALSLAYLESPAGAGGSSAVPVRLRFDRRDDVFGGISSSED